MKKNQANETLEASMKADGVKEKNVKKEPVGTAAKTALGAKTSPKAKATKKETVPKKEDAVLLLKKEIETKLQMHGVADVSAPSAQQLYRACVAVMKGRMTENREAFKSRTNRAGEKKVCYLCMEFLLGRSFRNNAHNLGIYDDLCSVLEQFGSNFDSVYACEVDPGLGNGGLGRLAACFMDSLTAQSYAANGYSLCYENGLFRQRLVDGEQVELPDVWMPEGGAWLVPRPERAVSVRFGGQIKETWENGELRIENTEYDEVRAVPYDVMIAGPGTEAVNTIRLWKAKNIQRGVENLTSQGTYIKAMEASANAEEITRQLYPPDNYDEGKLLRLTQQYFLVSASLQSIISDYFAVSGTLAGFENRVAIHINDTHPALVIPEMMRLLMDVYSYSWDNAWRVVTRTVSYTNHTVLPEALECWRIDLFRMKLPRIYTIVEEINRRFCAELWNLYPGDWDRIARMAVVGYGQVRMANLSVVGSHTVNGVSQLHSDILKKTVFHDFYKMTPWKFTNVTNGVVHRRWLSYANPALSELLTECIGGGFRTDASELEKFEAFAKDSAVLERLGEIKRANKERFAAFVRNRNGRELDPDSVFDVQVKRMHEYKRQLLNVLKIIALYNELCENPNADIRPQTFIFGAKAAPGYYMAKQLIRLICALSEELERNERTRGKIKVVFMEEYNVSMAEVLIPSADLSEQISLAGKEASGTGNMKFMFNGAVTVGTLDGANVEILDAVGDRNMYIFGLNTYEVDELWRHGYDAREFYRNSERLRMAVDRLYRPIGGQDFSHIADYLINGAHTVSDPFMCLADFDSYFFEYSRAIRDYGEREEWNRRALVNIARAGRFASDNSTRKYAEEIWHLHPVLGK